MNRRQRRTFVLAAIPMLLAPLGCSKAEEAKPSTSSAGTGSSAGATSTSSGAATAGAEVTAEGNTFTPAAVTVKAGEGVKFTNKDKVLHEPTAGTEAKKTGEFDIDIKAGVAGTTPALKAGTYAYYCQVHPTMVGTITVT